MKTRAEWEEEQQRATVDWVEQLSQYVAECKSKTTTPEECLECVGRAYNIVNEGAFKRIYKL